MADLSLAGRSALAGLLEPGRAGRIGGEAGVLLNERTGLGATLVVAHRGQAAELHGRFKALGIDLPQQARYTQAQDLALVWTGPDQWLVLSPRADAAKTSALLGTFSSHCSTVGLDDARTIVSTAGSNARDTLAKLLPVDLHPRVFRPGDAAVTLAATIPVTLWQTDQAPSYEIAVPRSFARSFWHALTEAAVEYGVAIQGGDAPLE